VQAAAFFAKITTPVGPIDDPPKGQELRSRSSARTGTGPLELHAGAGDKPKVLKVLVTRNWYASKYVLMVLLPTSGFCCARFFFSFSSSLRAMTPSPLSGAGVAGAAASSRLVGRGGGRGRRLLRPPDRRHYPRRGEPGAASELLRGFPRARRGA